MSTDCHSYRAGPRAAARKAGFVFVPQHRHASDRQLIADLRQVAEMLGGRTVTKMVYRVHGRFGEHMVSRRFGTWNAGLKKAGLECSNHRNTPASEIVADVRRVARKLKVKRLTLMQYRTEGRYSSNLISRRMGSWAAMVLAAGLKPSRFAPAATPNALLENLYQLWRRLGRQPKITDLVPPGSVFKLCPYDRCFGGIENALRALENWVLDRNDPTCGARHKTPRRINARLLYRVLRRDNFKCQACGRSPANEPGVKLQVDHIKPWSAGGETVEENLQTLCQRCNVGKSNL